jgi:GTPase SAR1 family protein
MLNYDYLFKVILLGDLSVGKSSIFIRLLDKNFNEMYQLSFIVGVNIDWSSSVATLVMWTNQMWDCSYGILMECKVFELFPQDISSPPRA